MYFFLCVCIHRHTDTFWTWPFFFRLESWRFRMAVLSNTRWRASLLLNCNYGLTYILFKWSPHSGDTNLLAESKYHWVYSGDKRLVLCYFTNYSLPFPKDSETVVWELGHLCLFLQVTQNSAFCWCCNLLLRRRGQREGYGECVKLTTVLYCALHKSRDLCCLLPPFCLWEISSLILYPVVSIARERMKKESCCSTVDKSEVWVFILKGFMYF